MADKSGKSARNPHGMKVGDSLYIVPRDGRPRTPLITSIGRTWAHSGHDRYNLHSLESDSIFWGETVYPSEAVFLKRQEILKAWPSLSRILTSYEPPPGMTLAKIAQIKAIIDGDENG